MSIRITHIEIVNGVFVLFELLVKYEPFFVKQFKQPSYKQTADRNAWEFEATNIFRQMLNLTITKYANSGIANK